MSQSNTPEAKFGRRLEKSERQTRAAKGVDRLGKPIKFICVSVRRTDVRRHRYLALNGLDYSEGMANVMLPEDAVTGPSLYV